MPAALTTARDASYTRAQDCARARRVTDSSPAVVSFIRRCALPIKCSCETRLKPCAVVFHRFRVCRCGGAFSGLASWKVPAGNYSSRRCVGRQRYVCFWRCDSLYLYCRPVHDSDRVSGVVHGEVRGFLYDIFACASGPKSERSALPELALFRRESRRGKRGRLLLVSLAVGAFYSLRDRRQLVGSQI